MVTLLKTTGMSLPKRDDFRVKVIKWRHLSTEDGFMGEPEYIYTIEIDGKVYHRSWSYDMPAEPWMLQSILENQGGPFEEDPALTPICLDYLLGLFGSEDLMERLPTVAEIEAHEAAFNDGWDAHKKYLNLDI